MSKKIKELSIYSGASLGWLEDAEEVEKKDLLLKDLCARLLYEVIVNAQYKDGEGWKTEDRKILGLYEDGQVYLDCVYTTIDCIKPYLRPMSSMTEEEKKEWYKESCVDYDCKFQPTPTLALEHCHLSTDWLLKHHFDFRGLIPMGLALEAPEGMY